MKSRVSLSCLFIALLGTPLCPQTHPTESLGKMEMAKHPLVLERPVGPNAQPLDAGKLRDEASELAKLAQSVPNDVEQVAQGKLPKDISDKLKRIEKLSKHLRGELTQ